LIYTAVYHRSSSSHLALWLGADIVFMALSCPTTITLIFNDLKRIDSFDAVGPWIQKHSCATMAQAHFNNRIPIVVTHFIVLLWIYSVCEYPKLFEHS
jgi:hypothetical protein